MFLSERRMDKLNSNALRTSSFEIVNDFLTESLNNGIFAKKFDNNCKNFPCDYGVVLYIVYIENYNIWATAIASGTDGEIWINSKTNEATWRGWKKISTI